jgi:hypothetical protein
MWGRGPALYKHNLKKKIFIKGQSYKILSVVLFSQFYMGLGPSFSRFNF